MGLEEVLQQRLGQRVELVNEQRRCRGMVRSVRYSQESFQAVVGSTSKKRTMLEWQIRRQQSSWLSAAGLRGRMSESG